MINHVCKGSGYSPSIWLQLRLGQGGEENEFIQTPKGVWVQVSSGGFGRGKGGEIYRTLVLKKLGVVILIASKRRNACAAPICIKTSVRRDSKFA